MRPGDDLTIVTWGATVEKSRQAAAALAAEDGRSVEVIDLRSLLPWDQELVAERWPAPAGCSSSTRTS